MIIHINDEGNNAFEEVVLKNPLPVLVDFWAPWCGPCKALSPIIDELAQDLHGKVVVTKLNVDDNPLTPTHYQIRGIPTVILFHQGQVVDTAVGLMEKTELRHWIEGHLQAKQGA